MPFPTRRELKAAISSTLRTIMPKLRPPNCEFFPIPPLWKLWDNRESAGRRDRNRPLWRLSFFSEIVKAAAFDLQFSTPVYS